MEGTSRMRIDHSVKCWYCGEKFNLIAAAWCECGVSAARPSKVCPHCRQCLCLHPDYEDENLWGDGPLFLRKCGFGRLFYLYL